MLTHSVRRLGGLLLLAGGIASVFLFGTATAFAADPGYPIWTRSYTGRGSVQWFSHVAACPNGDIVVAGGSVVAGHSHLVVSRYSAGGKRLWVKVGGLAGTADDRPVALAVDGLGNVVVASEHRIDIATSQYLVVKYSSAGRRVWKRYIDGGAGSYNDPSDLVLDAAGNAYITGQATLAGPFVASLTAKLRAANGTVAWKRTFSGINVLTNGRSLAVDGRGYVYVVGSGDRGDGKYEVVTVKLKPSGAVNWTREAPGGATEDTRGQRVALGPLGRLYVVGQTSAGTPSYTHLIIKYTTAGTEKWRGTYDAPYGTLDTIDDLRTDRFGNAFITGTVGSLGLVPTHSFLVRWTPGGSRWIYETPSAALEATALRAVVPDQSGGCYVAGTLTVASFTPESIAMGYLARISKAGTVRWQRLLASADTDTYVQDLSLCRGGLCLAGDTFVGPGGRPAIVVKCAR